MAPLLRALPSGIRVPQTGASLSMVFTVGLVQMALFPALSVMVISQGTPLPVRVQEPLEIAIPLSPSVLQDKVARTSPLVGVLGSRVRDQQDGRVVSICAMGEVQISEFPAVSRMVTVQL